MSLRLAAPSRTARASEWSKGVLGKVGTSIAVIAGVGGGGYIADQALFGGTFFNIAGSIVGGREFWY